MDTSLFVNYINPSFVIGLLVGAGAVELLHMAKHYDESGKRKREDEYYNDTKKIFEEA